MRRQRGFSLVELMVASTIGLLLMVVLATILGHSSQAQRELINSAQQIDNGSYAISKLAGDAQHAGFYGEFVNLPAAAALPDPCVTNDLAALEAALAFPVQGWRAPAASPVACINDLDIVPGSDMVVIRRASTVVTAPGALEFAGVYIQTNSNPYDDNPLVALGANPASFTLMKKDGATPADIRRLIVSIYFLSPCDIKSGANATCTADADGGVPVPTLKRLDLDVDPLTSTRGMQLSSIASGIERVHYDYGVDTDGDGQPNGAFLATPATVADWANVVSMRIHLLARNPQASPGYTDVKSYSMGTAGVFTPGGAFQRHLFSQVVRVNNVSARREVP